MQVDAVRWGIWAQGFTPGAFSASASSASVCAKVLNWRSTGLVQQPAQEAARVG